MEHPIRGLVFVLRSQKRYRCNACRDAVAHGRQQRNSPRRTIERSPHDLHVSLGMSDQVVGPAPAPPVSSRITDQPEYSDTIGARYRSPKTSGPLM
jgi:hypothetical protein